MGVVNLGVEPYSTVFVGHDFHETSNTLRSILVYTPSSPLMSDLFSVQVSDPYRRTGSTAECCSEYFDLDPPGHVRFPEYIEGLKSLPSQRFSDQYVFRRRSNIGAKVFEVIDLF